MHMVNLRTTWGANYEGTGIDITLLDSRKLTISRVSKPIPGSANKWKMDFGIALTEDTAWTDILVCAGLKEFIHLDLSRTWYEVAKYRSGWW